MKRKFIVAIDGPAGSGKSTVAKNIAKRMHFTYIDTGAMYRAITLKALDEKVNLENEKALIDVAKRARICLNSNSKGAQKVFLDGKDVTKQIRTPQLTKCVSYIAKVKGVRGQMVKLQRKLGKRSSSVLEGRDIGTVVFPDADIKFYLDASFKERTMRRFKELKASKPDIRLRDIANDLKVRDRKDITRKYAPLKKANDAICVDTTRLSIEEVTDRLLGIINPDFARLPRQRRGEQAKSASREIRRISGT